ncbi:hypothetical protein PSACC_00806 [Paramicrosporidium saccamoebae]|uniref:CWF21 domain-containing protein n=1 Tax=Paramicrosporidium saccamoebae TaxID=1246581 RepID=A0A2H9TNQ9_9FUNG|nr:hypothetical protein PSACC_00806 [Paramicrosporidium saccamoebae]
MYNGLGLRTARGSGTNGYVQRNLSFAKPKPQGTFSYDQPPPKPARRPNADILLHRSKRQIEVECLTYQEELEGSENFRKKQLAKLEAHVKRNSESALKEEKETEMNRIKDAFGISDTAVEGQAFKFESEKQREERLARYAEEERLEKRRRLRDR